MATIYHSYQLLQCPPFYMKTKVGELKTGLNHSQGHRLHGSGSQPGVFSLHRGYLSKLDMGFSSNMWLKLSDAANYPTIHWAECLPT